MHICDWANCGYDCRDDCVHLVFTFLRVLEVGPANSVVPQPAASTVTFSNDWLVRENGRQAGPSPLLYTICARVSINAMLFSKVTGEYQGCLVNVLVAYNFVYGDSEPKKQVLRYIFKLLVLLSTCLW